MGPASSTSCGIEAAFLLPRGEKDRMRGFGRRSLILKLPNPLTPPSPLRGEGDHDRCPCHFFLDICPCSSYTTIRGLYTILTYPRCPKVPDLGTRLATANHG